MWRAREIVIASLLILCPPCTLESPSSAAGGWIPSTDVTTAAALSSSDVTTPVGLTSTDISTTGTPPVTPPIQLPPPVTIPRVHVPFEWPATSTKATNLASTDGHVATKDLATTVQPTPPVELPQPVELQNQTDVLQPLEPLPPVELPTPDELPAELPPPGELPAELPPPDELPEFHTFTIKPVEFRLVEEIPSKTEESTPELQTMRMSEINTDPPHLVNKGKLILMPPDPVRLPPMEHLDMAPPVPFGGDTTSTDDTTNDTNSVTTLRNGTSGDLSAVTRLHCRAAHRTCVGVSETVRVYGQVEFAVPAYRYAAPFVLGVVLFVTLGFTGALLRKSRGGSKLNKASCILLVAIAAADMLTVTSAMFDLVHLYSASAVNYGTLPRNSCRVMYVLERLSAVPHTASIWITTVLAVQRYICVAKPFYASRLISVTSSYAISGAAFVSAVLFHVCRFVDARFEPVNITKTEFPNITIQTCDFKYADWITNPVTYEVAFAWTRVILVQLIPCVLLVTFASMMIRSLYSSSKALKHSKLGAEKKQSNRRLLTIFVVVVALIVSVVELVTGVLLGIHAVSISIGTYLLDYVDLKIAAIGIDITLYVSYFCVFVIYCLMSRKFRNRMGTLVEMMTCTSMYKTIRRRYRTFSAGTKAHTCGRINSDRTQTSIEATGSNLLDNGTHLKHSESAATRTTML